MTGSRATREPSWFEDMGRVVHEAMTQEVDRHRRCPHCGRDGALRHGTDSAGRRRFGCRVGSEGGCGRSFKALTPFARLRHSEQWGRMRIF